MANSGPPIVLLGLVAAFLQLLGYLAYVRDADIEPNPVTWLMFSYGTVLMTVLECASGATRAELLLPAVCSSMALFVAGRCWWCARQRDPCAYWPREWWPDDRKDRAAFQIDLVLTALYLASAMLLHNSWIGVDQMDFAVVAFLVAGNLTTFSAFFPLIRSVAENPGRERAGPWAIWASAYALLAVTTLAVHGDVWSELMLYPVLNAFLHGTVACLARQSRREFYLQAALA